MGTMLRPQGTNFPNPTSFFCLTCGSFFNYTLSWQPNDHRKVNTSPKQTQLLAQPKKTQKDPMYPTAILTLFLLLSPFSTSSPVAITDDGSSAYKALLDFNFPVGLLPKGAVGYELDQASGRFHVYLNGSCGYSLEGSYELKYKSTISGYISENRLSSLTGISVKVLFLWLNIVEVVRKGDELELSVGIAWASFPIDNFYNCPQCGCGFDCDKGQVRKLKLNRFVSSI
ncbi:hypothetical protein I3760_07G108800 [Carya illinoinensis]|nr:hypothetical protein I3760_07G108800 [Carya illinoinensis]